MIKIINNNITEWWLPEIGELNGQTVSGYCYLEKEVLYNEGWYEQEDIYPEAAEGTPMTFDYFEIDGNLAKVYYKIVQ